MTRRCQGGNEEVATCPGYKVASAPATDRYNIHAWVNILTRCSAAGNQLSAYLLPYLGILNVLSHSFLGAAGCRPPTLGGCIFLPQKPP